MAFISHPFTVISYGGTLVRGFGSMHVCKKKKWNIVSRKEKKSVMCKGLEFSEIIFSSHTFYSYLQSTPQKPFLPFLHLITNTPLVHPNSRTNYTHSLQPLTVIYLTGQW
jgi:hypothetical protein